VKCTNCGTENLQDATFCQSCGTALAEPATVTPDVVNSQIPAGVGTPASGTPTGTTARTSPSTEELIGRLQGATSRVEGAMGPYQQRLAPIGDALTPLEGIGKQRLAWIGSGLVIVGLFLPIKTFTVSFLGVSGSGSSTYWGLNSPEWILFFLLAVAAAGLAYLRMYVWLWFIGALLFVFFILGFINSFLSGVDGVGAHPSWGWIFLFPGALALIAAAAMRERVGARVN
jgi:hypothetical protein